jgi:hypothetical protein
VPKIHRLFVFYHLVEWWLICWGMMEMELIHGGAKVLGCAWLWFCFSCVWMMLVPRDRRKLWRLRIKWDNFWKLSTFLHIVCLFSFLFLGVRMVFYYACIEGKISQDAKLFGCEFSVCSLHRSFVVRKLELHKSSGMKWS